MIRAALAVGATQFRIWRIKVGLRCSTCGARFSSPGCSVGTAGEPRHTLYGGAQDGRP